MSVTIQNDKEITWDQVESAVDNMDGFSLEKGKEEKWWWITWVVDKYERYALKLDSETQEAFRQAIDPVDGMFVVKRPFRFSDGVLSYDIPKMDDMGIILRLYRELKVGYVSDFDEY